MSNNKGDTILITLDYTIEGVPIQQGDFDEIEVYIGSNRYLLSEGQIEWDDTEEKYSIFITQQDTFALNNIYEYQVRFRKGDDVLSDRIKRKYIGPTISNKVI